MSALLWIGYALPGEAVGHAAGHVRTGIPGGVALALEVDPDEARSEEGLLRWATAQNAVLAAYAEAGDVVPLPLGSVFSTEDTLRDHATRNIRSLRETASELAGHVEYALHVNADGPAPHPGVQARSGQEYLARKMRYVERRRGTAKDRRAVLDRVTSAISAFAKELRVFHRDDPDRLLDAAFLVSRERVAELTRSLELEAARSESLGLSFRLVGPTPAYSFAARVADHA